MPRRKPQAKSLPSASENTELVKLIRLGKDLFEKETVNLALKGDTGAARDILRDFVGAIDERSEKMWPGLGPPIHWAYARYLADAFKNILEGKDPAIALGIKSSNPGRRPGKSTHNHEALAAAYWYLVRRGFKPERANKELQQRVGADRTTIQKASRTDGRKAFRHPRLIDDEILKTLFKPYAAIIKDILAAEL